MITEAQFRDFTDKVFIRFDQIDDTFGLIFKKFDQIDERFRRLEKLVDDNYIDLAQRIDQNTKELKDFKEEQKAFNEEQKVFNMKIDERVARLEA